LTLGPIALNDATLLPWHGRNRRTYWLTRGGHPIFSRSATGASRLFSSTTPSAASFAPVSMSRATALSTSPRLTARSGSRAI